MSQVLSPLPFVEALDLTPSSEPLGRPLLSPEQLAIVQSALDGNSIFFTGGAGTGKSFVLKELIAGLRQKYAKTPEVVGVTAPTGSAASNIGGTTIHSFFGLGLALEPPEALSAKIRYNSSALRRWRKLKVLVIDEVSMLGGDLFDKAERIACLLRKSVEPFGGIQVVATGDFFQLPPVSKANYVKFVFEAETWTSVIKSTFKLETVYRQRDQEFASMLEEVRFGQLSSRTVDRFRSLSRPLEARNGVEPTELFPRRLDVDRANMQRFGQLDSPVHEYLCADAGTVEDPVQRERLLSAIVVPKRLLLRVGAQVMLVRNMEHDLVNGSVGCVVAFSKPPDPVGQDLSSELSTDAPVFPLVSFRLPNGRTREVLIQHHSFKVELPNGEVRASRTQLPLILAWAISIHKAQGQTLDFVKVDLQRVFEKGQVYVALSRATSLDGLQVLNFHPSTVKAHPRVVDWNSAFTVSPEAE